MIAKLQMDVCLTNVLYLKLSFFKKNFRIKRWRGNSCFSESNPIHLY